MDKLLKRAVSKQQKGDLPTAIQLFRKILKASPYHLDANYLLGTLYAERGELKSARELLERARSIAPRSFGVINNLGNVYRMQGEAELARACYEQAVTLDKGAPQPWKNLAAIHREAGRLEEAYEAYRECLRLEPDSVATLSFLLLLGQTLCRWEGLEDIERRLVRLFEQTSVAIEPMPRLSISGDAAHQLEVSRRWAARIASQHPPRHAAARKPVSQPLRIGYLSADFRDHVVGRIFAGIAEHHDQERFTVHAYSLGLADGSVVEAAIREAVPRFRQLYAQPAQTIAKTIAEDRIDLLVDLAGYTQGGRPEVLCYRPAPVQLSYLGYPGSSGAPWIDGIVANDTLIDRARERFYSESPVRLDAPWFAIAPERFETAETLTRGDLGLPDEAFVFACFNQSYKIRPRLFELWCGLLGEIEGSVLLALIDNPQAEAGLRQALQAAGIDPTRLLSFPRSSLGRYLGAQALADLFLDTYPYGAGATASYALWGGLPLLTRAGDTLISRAAASALHWAGCDELVVDSEQAYRERALELARNPQRLAAIRQRLLAARETSPLFDVAGFTRRLEQAYLDLREAG